LEDFNNALKCFKPASLHGIKFHQGSDLTWQDVGGLNDIKQTLKETLEWPAKVCILHVHDLRKMRLC
jgi:SpoVK/Ycf46/Vps4 family AAA+-type ATPase